jgi:HTH-type transcriptional regulator / antitoxin HipB
MRTSAEAANAGPAAKVQRRRAVGRGEERMPVSYLIAQCRSWRAPRPAGARDPELADALESGYIDFKVGALLRQAREKAGLTQEQVAERLATKKSAISRIENSAGSIRFSTLERYARAIGWHLSLDLRPPQKSASLRK